MPIPPLRAFQWGRRTERCLVAAWLRWKHPELDDVADMIEAGRHVTDAEVLDDRGG